jgi:hypothetical protein
MIAPLKSRGILPGVLAFPRAAHRARRPRGARGVHVGPLQRHARASGRVEDAGRRAHQPGRALRVPRETIGRGGFVARRDVAHGHRCGASATEAHRRKCPPCSTPTVSQRWRSTPATPSAGVTRPPRRPPPSPPSGTRMRGSKRCAGPPSVVPTVSPRWSEDGPARQGVPANRVRPRRGLQRERHGLRSRAHRWLYAARLALQVVVPSPPERPPEAPQGCARHHRHGR